jgi:conjugative relaxase-like TrwC/TraI family protein
MLRVNQSTDSSNAKSYYSASDYYVGQEQEMPGQWRGEGARLLGLSGEIDRHDWNALCDNQHPETGKRLTARQRDGRTVGYDFNFHIPKSVSLFYAETRDERILDAFRESVDATMQDIEQDAQARVRKGGKNENRSTGNLIWGEFVHFTSRPVEGTPDPHLHAHCFVQNVTFDREEGRWKAGQFRGLKADAPYYEAIFHARLGSRLAELGLPIERTSKGWELRGIEASTVRKFSRRTELIEQKAQELGIENPDAKSELGARTREKKLKQLSFSELQETWRERMSPSERAAIERLAKRIGSRPEPTDANEAMRSVEYAIGHEFERQSVVTERALMARALRHSIGKASVDKVKSAMRRGDLVYAQRDGRTVVTTHGVLEEEKKVVDFARKGRGAFRPFVRKLDAFRDGKLNEEQRAAVKHIVESRDRVILLRGKAGVGKTRLLKEAVDTIEQTGLKVRAFAPSAQASRGVLRSDGFKDADTVAMLLKDPRQQTAVANGVILIDEAGLLGSKTLAQVFDLAERANARVLLAGDRYQHASVERGSALALLEKEAGLKPPKVETIQRQKARYKEAIEALSRHDIERGFKTLDDLGWVREIPGPERYRQMASDYVEAVAAGKTALVISPTHAEGRRVTAEIRGLRKEKGQVGSKDRIFQALENAHLTEAERGEASCYMPGQDVLVFHQNAKGFRRGERVRVTDATRLPLSEKARYQVYRERTLALAEGDAIRITHGGVTLDGKHRLNNGDVRTIKAFDEAGNIVLDNGWKLSKDFGHLAYGYCETSHASQGKTVQRVFVAQGHDSVMASSPEQFYVSASRGTEQAVFYVGNKEEMLAAVEAPKSRWSAMDLLPRGYEPSMPEPEQERKPPEKELIYER